MKKLLSLVALLLVVSPLTWATNVDAPAARITAEQFLSQQAGNIKFALPSSELKLAHAELNSGMVSTLVYYIFNSDNAFVPRRFLPTAREIWT